MSDGVKRGRPKQFRNDAEKQKAYRERKKADNQRVELALGLLEEMESLEKALRNVWGYLVEKGRKPELEYHPSCANVHGWLGLKADTHFQSSWNPLLFKLLLTKGCLKQTRKAYGSEFYELV